MYIGVLYAYSFMQDENDKKQVQAPSYEQIIRSRLKEAYYENLKRSLGRN